LVPPRPQKETPTVAIEAMRIIAIGVEEQQGAARPVAERIDRDSAEIPVAPKVTVSDSVPPLHDDEEHLRQRGDTMPAAGMESEATSRESGSFSTSSSTPDAERLPGRARDEALPSSAASAEGTGPAVNAAAAADEPGPSSAVEAASGETAVDLDEPAASMKRRPPPPRRLSLPAPPLEAGAGERQPMASQVEVISAERTSAASATSEGDDDEGEVVESVETVEAISDAPKPVAAVPQASVPQAAPKPPSRVPKPPGGDPSLPQPSHIPQVPPRRPRTDGGAENAAPVGSPNTGAAAASGAPAVEAAPPSAATNSSAATNEKPKARARRPWWEELFNEDFSRALARPSEHQIEQEVTFIEESLGIAPGAVVLDLGCGCGDHAIELASRGYGIVGYDLSLHQLALAQESAQERGQKLNFMQGDMREMAFEEVFDAVYCWNTSFGYFEEDKNLAVAQRMFRALKPGGTLLLDVINRDFAAMDQPSSVWYEGDSSVCMDDMCIDFLTSRMRVKRSLILDDGRTRECTYSIRIYSLHELGKMLHDVGFRVTEASGHPTTPGVFLGQNSPRIIILAQKP
jgi:2-polyprenyl-3-methyl-5-hydroxy-6-metoxy-1,4-benzoquinol methylase